MSADLRTYGHRYGQAETVKDVAVIVRKALRADLKQAAGDEHHPLTDVAQVSVRYRTASMMQAIDVTLTYSDHVAHTLHRDATEPWCFAGDGRTYRTELWDCQDCGRPTFDNHRMDPRLDNQVLAAFAYVGFQVSSFNHDGSDIQTDHFDVRFYGDLAAKNPDATWSSASSIPSVWARHLHHLAERAERNGDMDALRRLEHDNMIVVCAAAGV